MSEFDPKKPDYRFAGNDGTKPIIIQDGRVFDLNGNSLDAQFATDSTAENLITWLHKKGFCCTPEARSTIIREKRRVVLMRQSEALMRENQRMIEEETARMELALEESQMEMQAQVELHLKRPEAERPPIQLTQAEQELLGGMNSLPEPPSMEDLAPEEMDELKAVVAPRSNSKPKPATPAKPKAK